MYEIRMTAINEVGTSVASPTAMERTREAGELKTNIIYFFSIIDIKKTHFFKAEAKIILIMFQCRLEDQQTCQPMPHLQQQ